MISNFFKFFFIVLPFVYYDFILDASGSPRLLFLSISLFIVYLMSFLQKVELKTPKIFSGIYLTYLFVVIIIAIISGNYIDYIEIIKRTIYFLFFIQIYNLKTEISRQKIISGIVVFLWMILIFGLIQYLALILQGNQDNLYAISSTFSHKNIYSSILVLSLPFVLLIKKSLRYKIILVSATLLLLVLLQTRSSLLALTISALILLLYKLDFVKKKIYIFSFITLGLIVLSGLLLKQIGTYDYFVSILDFNDTDSIRSSTIVERLYMWRSSLLMFCDHYLYGVGIGNWAIYFPYYGLSLWRLRQGEVIMQRPHNDLIENFTESGILGGLLFSILLLYPLVTSLKQRSKLFVSIGIISYIVISIFSFPQERVVPSLLFLVLIAFSFSNQKFVLLRRNGQLLIVFFLLATTSILFGKIKSEEVFKAYLINHKTQNIDDSISDLEESKSPFFIVDGTSTPIDWYIGSLYLNVNKVDLALSKYESALEVNPNHIHILNSIGGCYLRNEDYETAYSYFNKALEIAPYYEDALLNYAYSSFRLGNINKSIAALEKVYNKEEPKFEERILTYAKFGIEVQLLNKELTDEEVSILNNMLSNKKWLLSIVQKSYDNKIFFEEQIKNDLDFLTKAIEP